MGWLLNTIAKLILKAVCKLFGAFADDFVTMFGINIGAKFPSIGNTDYTLLTVLGSYGQGELDSVFDALFPMGTLKKLFIGMALVIATALLVVELIKVIAAPVTRGRKQFPATSIAKYAFTVLAIVFSYRIFICMEYVGNEFYRSFGNAVINNQIQPTSGSFGDVIADSLQIGDLATQGIASGLTGITGTYVLSGLASSIFNLIMIWLLLTNFIRLLIEVVERYVVLGILFYTAPLPFSTLVSGETSHIFSAWLRMTLSQMLLICTNGIFISVFLGALSKVSSVGIGNGMILQGLTFSGRLTWSIWIIMLVGWLLLAQRFDGYLNSLGLSTAQTGGGLASSLRSGMLAVGGVAGVLGRKYAGSDLRKNIKAEGIGPNRLTKGIQHAFNSARKSAADNLGTSSPSAERGINLSNTRRAAIEGLKHQGQHESAKDLRNNELLKGQKAKDAISTLSGNNPGVRSSLAQAKSTSLGFDKDGVLTGMMETNDGRKMQFHFNEDTGTAMGSSSGINVSATGNASLLSHAAEANGNSPTKAASAYASTLGSNYVAGSVGGVAAVKNMNTRQVSALVPEGSLGFESAKSIGGGYCAAPMSESAPFISADHTKMIDTNLHNIARGCEKNGSSIDAITGNLQELSDVANLPLPMAKLLEDSQITGYDKESGILSFVTAGGTEAHCDLLDSHASGSHISNSLDSPMRFAIDKIGQDEDGVFNAMYAATEGDIGQYAKSLKKQFEAMAPDPETAGSITIEPYTQGGYQSITCLKDANDPEQGSEILAYISPAGIAEQIDVNRDGNWAYRGDGNIAIALSERGKSLLKS